jgi:SAM-dependent methyltransferase
LPVKVIDLKRERLPNVAYDVITCFDVLEHVPDPVRTVKELRDALRPGGLLFLYAPFGEDPERPMHIVHDDRVFRLMRFLGFRPKGEWEDAFPSSVRAPSVYTRSDSSSLQRPAYYIYDVWMKNRIGDAIAAWWRRMRLQSIS